MDLKALQKINYGVYILCSKKNGKRNGQVSNAVMQVSSDPPTIAVSVNKQNFTHDLIGSSKVFSISILSKEAPLKFIGQFGFNTGRNFDKFANVKSKIGKTGAPIVLDHTVSYLEAEVIGSFDAATHTVFIGRVIEGEVLSSQEPMTYSYYHEVKKGSTPKNAPTYVKEKGKIGLPRFVCEICGYIYDPEKGDPESGVKPGTLFEDLPETWVCPVCGASKDKFKKEE